MKAILILVVMVLALEVRAVCFVPITRQNINPGQIPTSERYNSDFDNLYTRANNVPGDCLLDLSIQSEQIQDGSIESSLIANSSITAAKLAPGVIPPMGRPLRIKAYSSSAPWSRPADVGSIVVQVVGGGGGVTSSGGASAFGSHCSAQGGLASVSGGIGGSASGGDVNLQGASGEEQSQFNSGGQVPSYYKFRGVGGRSMLSPYGNGGSYIGSGIIGSTLYKGAGSGGYCLKLISRENLGDPETITIGAGGTGQANSNPGKSGLVLIYEFGK